MSQTVDLHRRALLSIGPAGILAGCGGGNWLTASLEARESISSPSLADTPAPLPTFGMPETSSSAGVSSPAAAPAPAPSAPAPAPSAPDEKFWTPNRDAAGNVLVAEFAQLPLLTWVDVGGPEGLLASVLETPHLPRARGAGPDGSGSIVAAWGGAAWDYTSSTMFLSGGGHGDGHECETGVYSFNAARMRFERVVSRQSLAQFQWWDAATQKFGDDPAFGGNGMNSPLKNGVPSSFHTYDGLVWIPPARMPTPNVRGGLFYPGQCRSVIDLDTGRYTTAHWFDSPDMSYQIAFLDGNAIYGPRGNFQHYRYLLSGTQQTMWSAASFGQWNSGFASNTQFSYNHKAWCWMRERREHVALAGIQGTVRVRYGQALDAGATTWETYCDPITLSSADGSHQDFVAGNFRDIGTNLLCAAGVHYDDEEKCIWVQANFAGSSLYKITGLSGSTWNTERISGPAARYTAAQGTFGRFRVVRVGGVKLAVRVTATTDPLQVLRLS
jgi:hypothetical protein